MILCVECITDQRERGTTTPEDLKAAATVVDGLALCEDHMIPWINGRVQARRRYQPPMSRSF